MSDLNPASELLENSDYLLNTPKACNNIESAKSIYREKLDEEEQGLYLKMDDEQIQEMKEFFDCYDDDGTGKINNKDIEKIMNLLEEYPSPEEIDKIVREIDYDGDGVVDFDEFTCLMVKHSRQTYDTLEEELETVFKRFDNDNDGFIG